MVRLHTLLLSIALSAGGPGPQFPDDASWLAAAYVEKGLPSPDRSWDGNDYVAAAAALQQIAAADVTHLPRFQSPRSGTVFARLVDPRNLATLRTPELPAAMRMTQAIQLEQAVTSVLVAYLKPVSRNIMFDDEMVELCGFMMEATGTMMDVALEIDSTPPPDAAARAARAQGFEKMRSGLSRIIGGALTTLEERDGYRVAARRRLAEHLRDLLPELSRQQTDLQRAEVQQRLAAIAGREPEAAIRSTLDAALAALKAAKRPR